MYGEGKVSTHSLFVQTLHSTYLTGYLWQSNYFKGSILLLAYLVIIVGFYLSGYAGNMEAMGIDRFDTLAIGRERFKTIGRGRSGRTY